MLFQQTMTTSQTSPAIFGYWALRGRSHVIRLIMQHLQLPYTEQTFHTPQSWYRDYKPSQPEHLELPFLRDGDHLLNQFLPVLTHLLEKCGHQNFLGVTPKHQQFIKKYLISVEKLFMRLMTVKDTASSSLSRCLSVKEDLWNSQIEPKLRYLEHCIQAEWFLGYLSVVDFDIYELCHYIERLFPQKASKFPRLFQLRERVGDLSGVGEFERGPESQRYRYLVWEMSQKPKFQA